MKREKATVRTVHHGGQQRKEANVVVGKVGCRTATIVLDKGAHISVVPDKLIEKEWYSEETVVVGDANGGEQRRKVAKVWLHVGGLSSQQKVAVSQCRSLDGKAINVSKEEELQLLVVCGMDKLEVCAVKTRAERELRRKKWVEEQKCLESEQPKCNVSPLMEQSVESDLCSPREERSGKQGSGVLDKQPDLSECPWWSRQVCVAVRLR